MKTDWPMKRKFINNHKVLFAIEQFVGETMMQQIKK